MVADHKLGMIWLTHCLFMLQLLTSMVGAKTVPVFLATIFLFFYFLQLLLIMCSTVHRCVCERVSKWGRDCTGHRQDCWLSNGIKLISSLIFSTRECLYFFKLAVQWRWHKSFPWFIALSKWEISDFPSVLLVFLLVPLTIKGHNIHLLSDQYGQILYFYFFNWEKLVQFRKGQDGRRYQTRHWHYRT